MNDFNTESRVKKLQCYQTKTPFFDGYLLVGFAVMVAGMVGFWLVLDVGLGLAR